MADTQKPSSSEDSNTTSSNTGNSNTGNSNTGNSNTGNSKGSNPNGPVWIIGGVVLVLSLVAIGVGFFRNNVTQEGQTAEIQVTASVSDSIVMPTAAPQQTSDVDLALAPLDSKADSTVEEEESSESSDAANPPVTGESQSTEAASGTEGGQGNEEAGTQSNEPSTNTTSTTTSISASSLALGQTLLGQSSNGSRIRLHLNAAPDAPVMHLYENGTPFVLLESDSDDLTYPIQVGGQQWYRVRADDGLVGWISGTNIGLSSDSPEPEPTVAG